jgi:hypothetical protein
MGAVWQPALRVDELEPRRRAERHAHRDRPVELDDRRGCGLGGGSPEIDRGRSWRVAARRG